MTNPFVAEIRIFAGNFAPTGWALCDGQLLPISQNTALFSLGNAILARPLPEITNAERLVWVTPIEIRGGHGLMLSHPDVVDYRNATDVFTGAAAMGDGQFAISTGGDPVRVLGQWVSGSYFDVLGVRFQVGRGFLPEEDVLGSAQPVIVISLRWSCERFGCARRPSA